MLFRVKQDVTYNENTIRSGTIVDLNPGDAISYCQGLESSFKIYTDYGFIPERALTPQRPFNVQTTSYVLELLKEIEIAGKIMFLDKKDVTGWLTFRDIWLLSKEEYYKFETDSKLIFDRCLLRDLIEEATQDMDISIYRCSHKENTITLTRERPGEKKQRWTIEKDGMRGVFKIFEQMD